ncbi:hypothetical protein [Pendulispora albinea]|uniref:Lipoprotein n=1 Tax=Pendulispora albinea TaxID=2741071 RepID=A0ABZ2M718_9BACT
MRRWHKLTGALAFAAVGIAASSCSSSPEDAPAKPKLDGIYEAAGPGSITSLAFEDASSTYFLTRPCDEKGTCQERGTYTLDEAQTELRLKNAQTGSVRSVPIRVTDVAGASAKQGLGTQGLVGGAGNLVSKSSPIVKAAFIDNTPLYHACAQLVGTDHPLGEHDPPRCQNYPVRVKGQLVYDDTRGRWCEYGSCGKSGQATCRDRSPAYAIRMRSMSNCPNSGFRCERCTYRLIECGSHEGCRFDDACVLERMAQNEHASFDEWAADINICKDKVAGRYSYEEWFYWMQGKPGKSGYDKWLPYEEVVSCDPVPCSDVKL